MSYKLAWPEDDIWCLQVIRDVQILGSQNRVTVRHNPTGRTASVECKEEEKEETLWFACFDGWYTLGHGDETGNKVLLAMPQPGHIGRPALESYQNPTHRALQTLKFRSDGTPRPFHGITFASHIRDPSTLHELEFIQALLRSQETLRPYLAFLPTSSFHITCLPLLHYSPADASDEKTARTKAAIQSVVGRLCQARVQAPSALEFKVGHIALRGALSVELIPSATSLLALRTWSQEVVEACGHPDIQFDPTYRFHVTLAYKLFRLPEETQYLFDLLARVVNGYLEARVEPILVEGPVLCEFQDMTSFQSLWLKRPRVDQEPRAPERNTEIPGRIGMHRQGDAREVVSTPHS